MRTLVSSMAALALLAGSPARAEEPPPVFVTVVQAALGKAKGPLPLLDWGILAWTGHFVNQDSMVKVQRFGETLGGFDVEAEAARAFGCVGAGADCTARIASTDPAEFEAALRARPDRAGFVVELLTEMLPEQMLMRASMHGVTLEDPAPGSKKKKRLVPGVGYIAVITVRAPRELAALRKTDPVALNRFWTQGEPSHLVSETQRGLAKLDELLALLAKDGRADGKMPEAWKTLPKVKEFKNTGRIACSGPAWCASTYVLEDNGDSFVLVSSGSTAGWFDAVAAAKETNLPFMAMMGIPGN
jgi:hypothetical protein